MRYGKTDALKGGELAEERRRNGIIRAQPLFHIEGVKEFRNKYMYRLLRDMAIVMEFDFNEFT